MSQEIIQKSLQIPEIPILRFPHFTKLWDKKRLDKIAKVVDGIHQTPNYVDSGVKFISVEDINNFSKSNKFIEKKEYDKYKMKTQKNDIFLTRIGTVGKSNIIKENTDYAYYVSLSLIRSNKEINSDYLNQYIKSNIFQRELWKRTLQNASPMKINMIDLKQCPVSFPKINEQEKIGDFLSKVDNKISLMKQKLEKVNKFKKYLLQNLFTDNKFKKQNIPKIRFPEFKEEWSNVRLMDISNIKGGKRLPKGYSLTSEKNKHPYITVSDMNKGSVNLKNIKYVPEDVVKKISKYTITDKDIFISVAGTLGIIGIIPSELNGANLTENADKITDIKIDQNFLFYLLNTDIIKKLIHRTKTDNIQSKLALKEIRKLEFYYPKDTKEETKIASFLSNIDKKINLIEININLLKKYKKGLLQKLFI